MVEWAESYGNHTVLGSIWPFDGLSLPFVSTQPGIEFQQQFVDVFAHLGGIIVMHDTPEFNLLARETLRIVVPQLKADGYTFVSLSQLLG
jgi:peptidoglycan/xylan/chitin deacetylase (PgdA/CDA1 family)